MGWCIVGTINTDNRTMKSLVYALAIALLLTANAVGQPGWKWAKKMGGNQEDVSNDMATDKSGNTYVVGMFRSTTLFVGTTSLNTAGGYDLFIVKYNSNGDVVWAKSAGGADFESARGVYVDASGYVYVTGTFMSPSITLGTITLTNSGSGGYEMFITKMDSLGNTLWAKSAGGTDSDEGFGVTVDAVGSVIVCGAFSSPTIMFDTFALQNSGISDVFVVKYNSAGAVRWAKAAGGNGSEYGRGIGVDAGLNIYCAGFFASDTFNVKNTRLVNANIGSSTKDAFVLKYDSLGNVYWAKGYGDMYDEDGNDIQVMTDGTFYLTGYFYSDSVYFDTYKLKNLNAGSGSWSDMYVGKFNASGTAQWVKSFGGKHSDGVNGIAVDADNNVYLTGYFTDTTLFGSISVVSKGGSDMFVAKLDATGSPVWANGAGNTDFDNGAAVALDAAGDVLVAGQYRNYKITFGTLQLLNSGINDVFTVKLGSVTGLDITKSANEFVFFPNPTCGKLMVQAPHALQQVTVTIVNLMGETVQQFAGLNGQQFELNVDQLPAGICLVRVVANEQLVAVTRIVCDRLVQ